MITWLEGQVVERKQWNNGLLSLKIQTDPLTFVAGQFVIVGLEHNGVIIHRPYSLINTPDNELLEIHFNYVADGEFSPLLFALKKDARILISNKPSGLLTLNEVGDHPYLWLFATGTGIGPFLSILNTADPWQRFSKIIVAYSVKTANDLAYRAELEQMATRYSKQLTFIPFVTREKVTGTVNSRITDFIKSGELEQLTHIVFSQQNSHVMLCGNAAMLDDVSALLEAKGLRRHSHRQPGNIVIEKYF